MRCGGGREGGREGRGGGGKEDEGDGYGRGSCMRQRTVEWGMDVRGREQGEGEREGERERVKEG